MTAFVTLAGVYNTPVFRIEQSRDQDLMTTSRALDQFLQSVEKRAYKIAQIGIVNSANVASTCASHGYEQSGSMWVHADGSWASVSGGRVSVGWKGYSLQELPYRNQGGWR